MTVHAVTYNLHYGVGQDSAYDLTRIVAAVEAADLIAFQEVSRGYPDNDGRDMVAELEALLPDRHAIAAMPADIDAGSHHVQGRAVTRRFQFGNMVLSRWPVISVRAHLLPRRRIEGPVNLQRGVLETLIATPDGPLRFLCLHLDHVDAAERLVQIEALRAIIDNHAAHGGAITGLGEFGYPELPRDSGFLVVGDYNMEPDSGEYRAMAAAGPSGFTDLSAAADGPSFHDPLHNPSDMRLDYVFGDAATAGRLEETWIDTSTIGSDHYPVHVILD